MAVWETMPEVAAESELRADFAHVWQSSEKVVYSTTLDAVATDRTRIERAFDVDAVRALKSSSAQDLTIGGPTLAADALKAGLVDEVHLFVAPVTVGDGKPAMPKDARLQLELLDERRFDSGTVYLRYNVAVSARNLS